MVKLRNVKKTQENKEKKEMKTGIVTTNTYLNHDTGQGHPERADRVTAVIDHLKKVKSKDLIN